MSDDTHRTALPLLARPSRYELRLEPDFEEKTFVGNVKIKCVVYRTRPKCVPFDQYGNNS